MYEEKTRKLDINWKSVLIKMAILLVVVFLVIWIISLVNKDDKKNESNLQTNLQLMKSAALEYFTEDKLPENVNGTKKITLEEMFDTKLVAEFTDQDGKECNLTESYIMATKINREDYTIKVKLVCSSESDYVINTVTLKDDLEENSEPIEDVTTNVEDEEKEEVENTNDNSSNNTSNSTNSSTNNNSSNKNNNSSNNKNNNSSSSTSNNSSNKNNNSSSSNKNTSTSNKTTITNTNVNKVTTTNKNNSSNTNTTVKKCTYGNLSYSTVYPLAYKVSGNCAVNKDGLYSATHVNKVSQIGAVEYKKLLNEMGAIETKTGRDLKVLAPQYKAVLNKAGTGYVGYQIYYEVEEKLPYYTRDVYTYYLDTNGNRKVVVDKRSSLTSVNNSTNSNNSSSSSTNNSNTNNSNTNNSNTNNSTSNNTVAVKSITLNKSSLSLMKAEKYTLVATINPSNATNKTVTWKSSNTTVAAVNSEGRVTARRAGTATITASVGGKSAKVKVTVKEVETYKYCKNVTETHYSTNYTYNSGKHSHSWVINFKNDSNMADVKITDTNYLTTTSMYQKSYNYTKNKLITSGNINNAYVVSPGSYKDLANHSLTNRNFNYSLEGPYKSNGVWNINARYTINNVNGVSSYYASNIKKSVYFVPFYFEITYKDLNNCVTIADMNAKNYPGYSKVS